MVLENWLTLSFRLRPFSAGTFDVAAATGFSTCKHKTDVSCKTIAGGKNVKDCQKETVRREDINRQLLLLCHDTLCSIVSYSQTSYITAFF